MSATIDSTTFSSYFDSAPVLNIPGFTHPVTDLYLDDILKMTQYEPAELRMPVVKVAKSDSCSGPVTAKPLEEELEGVQPRARR